MASSTNSRPGASTSTPLSGRSYFEQQREALLGEIAVSFEHVLANINKLNRSLEGVIAVGNEFSSVEALWSQFENVMAKEPEEQVEIDAEHDHEHETEGGQEGGGSSGGKGEEEGER